MLSLYQRTMFGKVENPKNEQLADLSLREFATFAPLIVLAVWIGIYPKPFIDRLNGSVNHVIARVSPQYINTASADCGAAPVTASTTGTAAPAATGAVADSASPQLLASNTANPFLASLPCGPDGKPLAPASGAAQAAEPR
jgi:NADH-quinone oxidoreductase subunit M